MSLPAYCILPLAPFLNMSDTPSAPEPTSQATSACRQSSQEQASHTLSLRQHWLDTPSDDFTEGQVMLHSAPTGLTLNVTLQDRDIYNEATTPNQRTWELGDVVEIFVAVPGSPRYWELHITPGNQRLQLAWDPAGFKAYRQGNRPFSDFFVEDMSFMQSQTQIDSANDRWHIQAFIPWSSLGLPDGQTEYTLEIAVCRYDATHNKEKATLSSTAPLTKASYHRRHEWDTLRLVTE